MLVNVLSLWRSAHWDLERTALRLVADLYDGALHPERLDRVLDSMVEPLDGFDVGLAMTALGSDEAPQLFQSTGLLELRPAFIGELHLVDPFVAYLRTAPIPVGEFVDSESKNLRSAILDSEYFSERLGPIGMEWGPTMGSSSVDRTV